MSHRRRNQGMWYADDFMLPYDGSADVSTQLNHIFNDLMVEGDTFVFRPDGQYLCNNEIKMNGVRSRNFWGQDAVLFGTVERNNKFLYVLNCKDIEFRDIHVRGYMDFDDFGSGMVVGVGTPTVNGTAVELNALNESVFVPRSSGNGWGLPLGRDKDGYCRIVLTLADTTHVANDCVIVVTNSFGTTLETITIPLLTSTPTDYTIKHRLIDPRDRLDWEVKKNTGTANTISLSFCKTISAGAYNPNTFNNAGWDFTSTKGFRLFNCSGEGLGGDAIQSSSSGTGFAQDAVIKGFVSRCCARQGVSFNNNQKVRFEDFDIYFSGRSAIDIEPESLGALCDDVTIYNGRIWSPFNSGITCTGWSWINRLEIADVELYDCGRSAFEGGSRGGKIHGVSHTVVHRVDGSGTQGSVWPDFYITGQNMRLWDINADRGFFFQNDSGRTDENGVPVYAGGYVLGDHSISRQANYGGIGVQPGVSVSVTGGPGAQQFPVPVTGRGGTHGGVGPAGGLRRFTGLDLEMHQDRLHVSYGGGIANSHLWAPAGHDVVNEPMYRVGAISGAAGTAVTLQASTARTTTGTTTAVDVGEASVGRFRLYITAISGTLPVLDVDVQQSHDNSTFTTIDSFPTVGNTASSEYSKVIEFRHSARYLRLSYTISGTSPSFTFSVIGEVNVVGTNFSRIALPATAGATTHAITFPTRTYSNPTSFALAGATGGSLTPSTTYFYRVAGRPLRGGPIIPLAEQSVALTSGQNAVSISITGMEQIAAGIHIAGLTIYRGTSAGVYNTRYDVLPRTRLFSAASGSTPQVITDLGPTANIVVPFPISQITLGYPASIPAKSGSFTPVDETGYELDTTYDVWVTTNWDSGHPYVTSKARTGFTINFPFQAPADGSGRVSWELIR